MQIGANFRRNVLGQGAQILTRSTQSKRSFQLKSTPSHIRSHSENLSKRGIFFGSCGTSQRRFFATINNKRSQVELPESDAAETETDDVESDLESDIRSEELLDEKNEKKSEQYEVDYLKFTAKNPQSKYLDKAIKNSKILEDYAKTWISAEGIPLIHPEEEELDYLFPEEKQVITPKLASSTLEKYNSAKKNEIAQYDQYADRAFRCAERAYQLRLAHWGKFHALTINALLILARVTLMQNNPSFTQTALEEVYSHCEERFNQYNSFRASILGSGDDDDGGLSAMFLGDSAHQKEEHGFRLTQLSTIVDSLSRVLQSQERSQEALELVQNALRMISPHRESHLPWFVMLTRQLANLYIDLGKLQCAEVVMDSLVELQKSPKFLPVQKSQQQGGVEVIRTHEFSSPVMELLRSIVQLAKIKQHLAKWDESEAHLRGALVLSNERFGQSSMESLVIHRDLLSLISARPDRDFSDLKDLLFITLDVANELHEKQLEEADSVRSGVKRVQIRQSLVYPALLQSTIEIFSHKLPEEAPYVLELHREYYRVSDRVADVFSEVSPELCETVIGFAEFLQSQGLYREAYDLLTEARPEFDMNLVDPSPVKAYALKLRAEMLLYCTFPERASELPLIRRPETTKFPEGVDQTFEIQDGELAEAVDLYMRCTNGVLIGQGAAGCLYSIAVLKAFQNDFRKSEQYISRAMKLLIPQLEEKRSTILTPPPQSIPPHILPVICDSSLFYGSLLENCLGAPKRAKLYYQLALTHLRLHRVDAIPDGIEKYRLVYNDEMERASRLESCLNRLIHIQKLEIAESENPSLEQKQLLVSFQEELAQVAQLREVTQNTFDQVRSLLKSIAAVQYQPVRM